MVVRADEIYSVATLCEASGFGETFLRQRIADGSLKARAFGRRMLKIKGRDFLEWFEAQPLKSEVEEASNTGAATERMLRQVFRASTDK